MKLNVTGIKHSKGNFVDAQTKSSIDYDNYLVYGIVLREPSSVDSVGFETTMIKLKKDDFHKFFNNYPMADIVNHQWLLDFDDKGVCLGADLVK